MIEYEKFSIDFEFESGAEIGKDFSFTGLDILETVNQIPYFELGLESNFIEPLSSEKTVKMKYQSDNLNYECPLGINNMVFDGKSIILRGWLTEWENFKLTNTRFLGSDIKAGLKKLKIRDQINYDDNLTGNLFQINESNLHQCLDLCMTGSKFPYWSIGRYSINMNELNEDAVDVEPISGGKVLLNTIDHPKIRNDLSNGNWFSNYGFYDKILFSDYDNKDQFANLLNTMKFVDIGMKYYMQASTQYEYEWVVGSKLNNTNDIYPEIKNWIVTSVYYHYRRNAVLTDIQYGGII